MKSILRLLERVEAALGWLAALAMFAIMSIVALDVALRYVFHSPQSWAFDIVSLYLVAAVFYLSVSNAYREGAHVNVDILQQKLPPAAIRVTEIIITATGATVFALVAWLGAQRALEAFGDGDVLSGAIPWPTWPAQALVPLGCGLLALRLGLHCLGHAASLVTGREVIAPGAGRHGETESFE